MDALDPKAGERASSPGTLILVSIMDTVLLPGVVMPLTIASPAAAAALQEAARTDQPIALVLQRQPYSETPSLADLHPIGSEARLLRYFTGRDGSHNAIMQGVGRIRIEAVFGEGLYPTVDVQRIIEPLDHSTEIDARLHQLRERGLATLRLIEHAPAELSSMLQSIDQAGALAYFVTGMLDLSVGEKK